MKKGVLLILIIPLLFAGLSTQAQLRETDVSLIISPATPSSNQNVEASLESQSVDLNKALISWSLNGEDRLRGIGKTSLQFTMGALGSSAVVYVSIETTDGTSIQKSATVRTAEVDMLFEAVDSYTPPFYKGRTLPVSQGKVKVVAIPSLSRSGDTNSSNFSYTWSKDGKTQPQYSGWGKNYIMFTNSYLDQENEIKVEVSDILGNKSANGNLNLQMRSPKILFYQNKPISGTNWNQALQNGFSINPEGETIVAEPYFFSEKNLNSPKLSFEWFLNGQKIETPSPKNILSVRLDSEDHGTAIIKTLIENIDTLFQSKEGELSISF